MDERLEANRVNWDDRVPIHVASTFYDVEGGLAAGRGPRPREVADLGIVDGLDLVHLQCHFGQDTLAFARAGARVTGLDFSSAAIAQARRLAERSDLADRARFVEGDVMRAAEILGRGSFDLVYVSLGSLTWLPSVMAWAGQVAALLRPGGRLYLHDVHPLCWAMGDDDLDLTYSYFEEDEPLAIDSPDTYTDGDGAVAHTRTYEWNHSIGEIVNAVVGAGLRVDRLTEHDWTVYAPWPWMVETEPGRYELPEGRPRIPLTYTLLATQLPERPFPAPLRSGDR